MRVNDDGAYLELDCEKQQVTPTNARGSCFSSFSNQDKVHNDLSNTKFSIWESHNLLDTMVNKMSLARKSDPRWTVH